MLIQVVSLYFNVKWHSRPATKTPAQAPWLRDGSNLSLAVRKIVEVISSSVVPIRPQVFPVWPIDDAHLGSFFGPLDIIGIDTEFDLPDGIVLHTWRPRHPRVA